MVVFMCFSELSIVVQLLDSWLLLDGIVLCFVGKKDGEEGEWIWAVDLERRGGE